MVKRVLTTCLIVGVMTVALSAQQKPAGQPAAQAKPQPAPQSAEVKHRNVSIEVTITDQMGSAQPVTKVVTMIVADGRMGSVRHKGSVTAPSDAPAGSAHPIVPNAAAVERRPVTLNVDAAPTVRPDGSILLSLTLEYLPSPEGGEDTRARAQLNEGMSVTLESGKALVISLAADPGTNRKIGVEVTATVMK